MKTDRELLELAAKAAGIDLSTRKWHGLWYVSQEPNIKNWNPLTDDGDALRLAVKLNLLFSPEVAHGISVAGFLDGADPYAATRRAIVRVAAAYGEGMAPFPTAEEIERFAGMDGKPEWDK